MKWILAVLLLVSSSLLACHHADAAPRHDQTMMTCSHASGVTSTTPELVVDLATPAVADAPDADAVALTIGVTLDGEMTLIVVVQPVSGHRLGAARRGQTTARPYLRGDAVSETSDYVADVRPAVLLR